MKRVIFVVLLIGISFSAFSQGWELISPKPTFRDVKGISFITNYTGYICDDYYVYRTYNGGLNWQTLDVDTNLTETFNDVEFLNLQKGFALKANSIFMTNDGGETWQMTGSDIHANTLYFFNESIGYVYGDNEAVYKTTDGGYTWLMIMSGQIYHTILDLEFSSPDTGYLVTGYQDSNDVISTLKRTTDGGTTWTDLPAPGNPYSITVTGSHLWLGTHSYSYDSIPLYLYHSSNGGALWDSLYVTKAYRPQALDEVRFFNPLEGYVCYHGKFYTTTDGGTTWTITSPSDTYPNGCYFENFSWTDPLHGYFCGRNGDLAKTADRSATFTRMGEGYNHNMWFACWFFDMQRGIAAIPLTGGIAQNSTGAGTYGMKYPYLVYTNDGALTWDTCNAPLHYSDILDIKFTNDSTGWATCDIGLFATTDGGINWDLRYYDMTYPTVGFNNLCIVDSMHIYNHAWDRISASTDGGYTWVDRSPTTFFQDGYSATAMCFPDTLTGYCAVLGVYYIQDKLLLKTTDGGITWVQIGEFYIGSPISNIEFYDASNGIMYNEGNVMITHDGGITWTSDFILHLGYVKMFDPQTIMMVVNSEVWVSYDGGVNFIPIYGGYSPMNPVRFSFPEDPDHGFAMGFGAMIMKYDVDYHVNSPTIQAPVASPLFYPNPAATTITLKEPCVDCTITIYTIEGRPVLTVPGSSGSEIDISALHPGMYLFALTGKEGRRVSKLVKGK